MSLQQSIQQLDNKLLSNYYTMLATCDAYINRGIDVKWYSSMKDKISEKINEIKISNEIQELSEY